MFLLNENLCSVSRPTVGFLMMDMNDFSGLFQLRKFAKIYIYMQINACITNYFLKMNSPDR